VRRFFVIFLLTANYAVAAPSPRPRVVRGLDGQSNLVLDYGRALKGIDRLAPTLSAREKVLQLVTVVRARLPNRPNLETRYDRLNAKHATLPLSTFVRRHVGMCRERAFLLSAMAKESGLQANVKYGEVYDKSGTLLGGHAWVQAFVDGKRLVLDPSSRTPVQPVRTIELPLREPGKRARKVNGAVGSDLIYRPMRDLHYL
jgi:hypothetical protein